MNINDPTNQTPGHHSTPDHRETDGAPAGSRSEGVSFAPLIPFFIILSAVVMGAFTFAMWHWQPTPVTPAAFAQTDRDVESLILELFQRARSNPHAAPAALFLSDMDTHRLNLRGTHPFSQLSAKRVRQTAEAIRSGDYERVTAYPLEPAEGAMTASIVYRRRDINTGIEREVILWLARNEQGWRVGGFE